MLLTALDDLLLAGQDAGALLCLLNDAFGLNAGVLHDLLAVIHDFFALADLVGQVVAHLIDNIAHTVHIDHALGSGERNYRPGLQRFLHHLQQFFNVHTSSPLS